MTRTQITRPATPLLVFFLKKSVSKVILLAYEKYNNNNSINVTYRFWSLLLAKK